MPGRPSDRRTRGDGATRATAAAEARLGLQPRRGHPQADPAGDHQARTWIDGEKIPATGGCILVFNHVSHLDPLTAAHFVYDHGRMPRYLAKSGLFKNPALGYFLRAAGQIPVERLTKNAEGAFDAAVAAVEAGECVVVYPEGTLTRDPDLWPMVGKSGAARIALETGCPVIPVGQWGAQELLEPYAKRPHLFPRKHDHDEGRRPGRPRRPAGPAAHTQDVINEATDRIMDALTALVEELRGEKAPAERFDPRKTGRERDRQPAQAGRGRRDAMTTVAVFGAGSWGTAFSLVLADAGNDVTLWARREEVCDDDQRAAARTPTTCPASSCRRRSRRPTTPSEALAGAEVVVFAVPSQTLPREPRASGRRTSRATPCWSR